MELLLRLFSLLSMQLVMDGEVTIASDAANMNGFTLPVVMAECTPNGYVVKKDVGGWLSWVRSVHVVEPGDVFDKKSVGRGGLVLFLCDDSGYSSVIHEHYDTLKSNGNSFQSIVLSRRLSDAMRRNVENGLNFHLIFSFRRVWTTGSIVVWLLLIIPVLAQLVILVYFTRSERSRQDEGESRFFRYSDSVESKGCMICLEPFQREDRVTPLECSHFFHQTCLDRWLLYYDSHACPYCKAETNLG